MGAWDTTSFGNDTACDWLAELKESEGSIMIEEALDAVLAAGDEMIEASTAEEGIAAAEVVAWVNGQARPGDEAGDDLQDWIDDQDIEVDGSLQSLSLRVVDRVFNDPSELKEIWEESEDFAEWRKALADLKERLQVS
ncbi:MAG: DUF4259 domain-containing protein [Verrucomicrobiales bacterium]